MPVRLYVLLTWTTLRRLPLLNPDVARFLDRFLRQEAARHGARVLELGIVSNHVHAIAQLPPVIDISRLVQGLKGASARIANRDGLMPRARLRWADGYDLRSVGVRQLAAALRYVRTQRRAPSRSGDQSFRTPSRRASPSGDVITRSPFWVVEWVRIVEWALDCGMGSRLWNGFSIGMGSRLWNGAPDDEREGREVVWIGFPFVYYPS